MQPSRIKWALAIAAIVVVVGGAFAFQAPRSALARTAVAMLLKAKGFELAGGELQLGGGQLNVRNLLIVEKSGAHFVSAKAVHVGYQLRGMKLSIGDVRLDQPYVSLRKQPDGSFNFSRLTGSGAPSTPPAQPNAAAPPPLHLRVAVHDARLDLDNPYAPARPGRHFSVDHIELAAIINAGSFSHGYLRGLIRAGSRVSPVAGTFFENDVARVAELRARSSNVALAPVLDLLIAAPAFTVEAGSGDLNVHAYALGWPIHGSPQWHLSADGTLANGRLRVVPLIAPVRELDGPFKFYDGTLTFSGMTGNAAGVPLTTYGAILLSPSLSLNLTLDASGPLERVKGLLAVLKPLPLHGNITLRARVDGAPTDPRVAVAFALPHGLRYGRMPLSDAAGSVVYFEKHILLPAAAAGYAGFRLGGNGDIDLTSAGPPSGRFVIALRGPVAAVPWLANLDDDATLRAHATLAGPLTKLQGDGLIVFDGHATKIRTAFSGGIDNFSLGPLIASDRRGGSLWLAGAFNRRDATANGHLIAHNFSLALNGRRTRLPGIFDTPFGMPPAAGTWDGVVNFSGPLTAPSFTANLHARQLVFAGAKYGALDIAGLGSAGSAHILNVAVQGPSLKLRAHGDAARSGRDGAISGDLAGWTVVHMDAFSRWAPVAGLANASFVARFGDHQMIAGVHLRHSSARVAGVPLRAANVLVGVDPAHVRVYAATAALSGGNLIASGELPMAQHEQHTLNFAASHIQLGDLRGAGVPLNSGEVTAFGSLSGSRAAPVAAVSGSMTGADVAGRSLSADAQLEYRANALTSRDSRIFIGDSTAIDLNGSINGLTANGSPAAARLHLSAAIRDADLQDLAPMRMDGMPLVTGDVDGMLSIGGTMADPFVSGHITSDTGSVHGLTYEGLQADVAGGRSGLSVSGGQLLVGSSPLRISGFVSPTQSGISFSSRHLDLADFNDYFNGADVLEGVGAANLSLTSSPARSTASGYLRLQNAVIARLPLGTLQTRLSTKAGSILADIRQRGQLATTSVRGSVSFPRHVGMLPDFGQAVLATTASAKNVDIGMLAPLLPSSAEGVGGKLNLDLTASGSVSQLRGRAQFNLVHGFVRKDRIDELAGQVTSDAGGIRVPRLRARMNGASLVAQGTLTRDHRLRAHAVVATSDVATLTRVANVASPIKGAMSVALDAAGSLQQPLLHALFKAAPGSVYGVAYDGISADANYAPGRIAVRSAKTQLSGRRGSLALEGTVPIPFGPQPAQRNHLRRPMAMRFVASGIDLAAFDPLLREQGTLAGRFDLNARAQGSLAKPKLSGNATLRDAAIQSKRETVPLTALNADVSFSNDAIIMPSLRGKLGGGTIAASAFGRLQPPTRSNPVGTLAYAMRLVADRANLTVPQLFSGVVSAQLALQSNHNHPSFAGGVTLENTQVPFAGILALASGSSSGEPAQAARVPGVPPLRQGHFIWYAGSIYGDQPHFVAATPPAAKVHVPSAAPVALNVDINAAKNVAVTGLVNATGEGTVHLGGTAAAPKLKGTLRTIRGEIGAFDTIFHLERGRVSFHPADGFLPTVSAKAVAERPEAEITVTISGRVDRMRTQLESDPPMPQAAILADMLHINQIDAALSGGASGGGQPTLANPVGVAQNLASAALTGKLLSAINYGLEQSLDISEVDFAFDSHGQPSLELRKQYGKNLYALFRTSFQVPPEQSVGIAYDLRDALEMEFVQKQNTAGQSIGELTQTTSFQVNVRFP